MPKFRRLDDDVGARRSRLVRSSALTTLVHSSERGPGKGGVANGRRTANGDRTVHSILESDAVHALDDEHGLLGTSPAIESVRRAIARAVDMPGPILVTGETGTGKEVVARLVHAASARRDEALIAVNCAAIPESILESQLFGHVRGAFTDAKEDRPGVLVRSDHGTLLLDEIADAPLALQAKILRAVETGLVLPVGGSAEVPFDARLVATTNKDLDQACAAGRFRSDLFFRLAVFQIRLPPLRDRGEDVLLLAHAFLHEFAELAGKTISAFSPAAIEALRAHSWPGNIRELRNCVMVAVASALDSRIRPCDLQPCLRPLSGTHALDSGLDRSTTPVPLAIREAQSRLIAEALARAKGKKTTAARLLGIHRTTLYRRTRRHGHAG